jgi:hypothetical protein
VDVYDFFNQLFGEDVNLTETISLWEFTADQGITTTYHSSPKAAAEAVAGMSDTSNVYFGTVLRTPALGIRRGYAGLQVCGPTLTSNTSAVRKTHSAY